MTSSTSSSSLRSGLFSLLVFLSPLALLLLVSPLSSHAQPLVNVTGTATCTYNTYQQTQAINAYIAMTGSLTINLTAKSYSVPQTPGFTNATFLNYPIIAINGTRQVFSLSGDGTPNLANYNITGIGANRTIYLTFDPSQDVNGFPTDGPGYLYRFDSVGITLLTSNPNQTSVQFYEASNTTGDQSPYNERGLNYPTVWAGASLSLGPCTQTYSIIPAAVAATAAARVSSSSSTASAGPATAGGARGDPSFTGFRGQAYQVHGMADTVYNVITDKQLQLNALFVFLTQGACPTVNGQTLTNCWSHPGSYFGALALRTAEGDRLLITAGPAATGFSLTLNDAPLTSSTSLPGLSISLLNSHQLTVQAGVYRLSIENSDAFLNLAQAEVLDWQALKRSVQSHGLLGQTWESRKGAIEGDVDDYAEADNDLFGTRFLHNKFALAA